MLFRSVLDDDAGASTGLEHLDEVLQEQERGLAGADREVLLHLGAFLAAEGRIGEHDIKAVLVLDVREAFGERVGVDDVRRLDAVQDHVHDRSEEHTSELQSLMRISYAVFCLKKKKKTELHIR